ncbi:GTPase Obg [Penicillium alfredii]|uniref:GTPase Obg n=1 Tax=Penicillium alfredii TaxID=1506179 RepID=A0A9W9F0G1_9EURO|nr:GTPase Obg [Penicillium alfredii]KAJ5091240.1 GTPase Obg [Penicillium alfredii]
MAHPGAYFYLPIRSLRPRRAYCPVTLRPQPYPRISAQCQRWQSSHPGSAGSDNATTHLEPPSPDLSHLNPAPDDYSRFIFQDKCQVTMHAGAGGNGCVSFLREKYIEEGPPNGGDGGSGGGLYIQAVEGLTSLHKLARRGVIRASRGKNGQGKSKGGKRGDDILIQVPVGTVVREVERHDPVEEEIARRRIEMKEEARRAEELKMAEEMRRGEEMRKAQEMEMEEGLERKEEEMENEAPEIEEGEAFAPIRHDRWVLYPGAHPSDFLTVAFPKIKPRRQQIAAMEPQAPIFLDLSKPTEKPILLAAGGAGGLGNPHFASRSMGRPKFAARGEGGMRLELDFELKLLADVGLVGKPNAGKSTLLRSLTNSRTRIGNWEFTTLSPWIGTVVIDDNTGRPLVESKGKTRRTNFTIADIPGLVEDAHLDRGLGLGFLRHIDRAGILAFVLDLSAGDPVQELQKLWHELGEYERLRDAEPASEEPEDLEGVIDWGPSSSGLPEFDRPQNQDIELLSPNEESVSSPSNSHAPRALPHLPMPPLHTKPWFVVATKADLENTQDRYRALQEYLSAVQKGLTEHPSGNPNGWKERLHAVPVSAMRGEGVSHIPRLVMEFLE